MISFVASNAIFKASRWTVYLLIFGVYCALNTLPVVRFYCAFVQEIDNCYRAYRSYESYDQSYQLSRGIGLFTHFYRTSSFFGTARLGVALINCPLSFAAQGDDTLITAALGDTIRAVGMSLSIDDCRFGATGYETEYNILASSGVFA